MSAFPLTCSRPQSPMPSLDAHSRRASTVSADSSTLSENDLDHYCPSASFASTPSPSSSASSSSSASTTESRASSIAAPPTSPDGGLFAPVKEEARWDEALDIDNRDQMDALMSMGTSVHACEMASEVISLIIPAAPPSSRYAQVPIADQKRRIVRYLAYWTALTPHPLCVLIASIILLERLKTLHPSLSATGQTRDTALRVTFSAILLAIKWTSDCSHTNLAFVRRTPWSLSEINAMEKEMLSHLKYDIYISAAELISRANSFWARKQAEEARYGLDDGLPDIEAGGVFGENLFLAGAGVAAMTTAATAWARKLI